MKHTKMQLFSDHLDKKAAETIITFLFGLSSTQTIQNNEKHLHTEMRQK